MARGPPARSAGSGGAYFSRLRTTCGCFLLRLAARFGSKFPTADNASHEPCLTPGNIRKSTRLDSLSFPRRGQGSGAKRAAPSSAGLLHVPSHLIPENVVKCCHFHGHRFPVALLVPEVSAPPHHSRFFSKTIAPARTFPNPAPAKRCEMLQRRTCWHTRSSPRRRLAKTSRQVVGRCHDLCK